MGDTIQPVCKDLPLAGHVTLEGQEGRYYRENNLEEQGPVHSWYGPFATMHSLSPTVAFPEGVHTATHITDAYDSFRSKTSLIKVTPCFIIASRDKRSKVQITWPPQPNIERYDVFRADGIPPFEFVKIAETVSDYATYLDYGVENENSYLYLVGALIDGQWSYSNVTSAHPTAVRTRPRPNYEPMAYSDPITRATVGIAYNYDVNATDPTDDILTYSLLLYPKGMTIEPNTGLITWMPEEAGRFPVSVQVDDSRGGTITQAFEVNVDSFPLRTAVSLTSTPKAVSVSGKAGQVTLSWTSAYADTVSIDNGIGTVRGNGSITTSIKEPTTFTITATGLGGTATDSVTVRVLPSVSITAAPETILAGEMSYLSWASDHADSVVIDQGIGQVPLNSTGQGLKISPNTTATYTITAYNALGTDSDNLTVTVNHPPTIKFSADPLTVKAGNFATLTWSTINADTVTIDNGIGNVPANGSIPVAPTSTTTYTMTATGPGGIVTSDETITIIPLPAISFNAAPQNIHTGASSTLTWSTINADTVTIDNGVGNVPVNGSVEVSPYGTTTYTLTAIGQGGTETRQITINISNPFVVEILSPPAGAVVNRPDILVHGNVSSELGGELGVTVNGQPTLFYGNRFAANHVCLEEGENTIAVIVSDSLGNRYEKTITIQAVPGTGYVSLKSDREFGLAPLSTDLNLDSTFILTESPFFSNIDQGAVNYTGTDTPGNIKVAIPSPGIYFFTAETTDQANQPHTDTIAVLAMDRTELDLLLQTKWNNMKTSLASQDIDGAMAYFTQSSRESYHRQFTLIRPVLSLAVEDMGNIHLIDARDNQAVYDLRTVRDSRTYSFQLQFFIDKDGIWRIRNF